MKHFKLIFLCLFIIISTVYYSYSQDAGVTSIGSVTTCFGTGFVTKTITVPIYVNNSPPISGLSLRIEYDGSVLSFLKVDNTNNGLDLNIIGAQTTSGGITKLMLSWTGSGNMDATGLLCNLEFNYYGGYTSLNFNNSSSGGHDCEYADINGDPLNDEPSTDFYIGGYVGTNLYLGDISGNQNPLINTEEVYSVSFYQNVNNYEWTIPSAWWTGTSTTNSITIRVGKGSGYITMTPYDNCGKGQPSIIFLNSFGFYATATPPALCELGPGTFNLNVWGNCPGDDWFWYNNSCGGNFVGQGPSFAVNVNETSTFWVRGESTKSSPSNCVSVTVLLSNNNSTQPDSFITNSNVLCQGIDTLCFAGGTLDSAAHWVWYSGSCGGTLIGSDTTSCHIFNPTIPTDYFYVRAEGVCNTTSCITVFIINNFSTTPTIINNNTYNYYCPGSTSNLEINSGILGNNARWAWYQGSCGNGFLGSGKYMNVSPTATTIYWARGEGPCDTTSCTAYIIQVASIPIQTATTISICPSWPCSLYVPHGSYIFNSQLWQWYDSSGPIANGNPSILYPPPTTTTWYYLSLIDCNTYYDTVLVVVYSTSIPPDSIHSSTTSPCPTLSATLSVSGGSLGYMANWNWYSGSCGGNYLASGSSIIQSPNVTTVYYVQAIGTCNTTSCVSKIITANTVLPDSLSASLNAIFTGCNINDTLRIIGGLLGSGAVWNWYTGSCNGTYFNSGSLLIVNPTITTTYWMKALGTCNTTACLSITVVVYSINSTIPTSISASSLIVCGASSTLTLNGGSLGTGACWYWYTGSCGGNLVTSTLSNQLIVSPIFGVTTYYVRAQGACDTTSCLSITLTSYNSILGIIQNTNSALCPPAAVNMQIVGGVLGTGANWYWYKGSCGGVSNYIGSGVYLKDTITVTTTYWVRAEGFCNTTPCIGSNASIYMPATSITATQNPICQGMSVTLTGHGGGNHIGFGLNHYWNWFTDTISGHGLIFQYQYSVDSIAVTPTTTTTYYYGTGCPNAYLPITITVNIPSVAADSMTATPSMVCPGQYSNLMLLGGLLGTGADWYWYSGSCGGTAIGSGTTSLLIVPTATTTYYVRAEGICNTTNCTSLTITYNTNSTPSISASATPSSICPGNSTNLGISGGTLGTGANWYWYTNYCGGTYTTSGATPVVSPLITTTYYIRAEGYCNTTSCSTVNVTVYDLSTSAISAVVSNDTICLGSSSTVSISGGNLGTNANWVWYTGSCGGTYVISGSSPVFSPTVTTSYYVRAEGTCNTTNCVSVAITVNLFSNSLTSIIASPDTLCIGNSSTLNVTGGYLGTNAAWKWYTDSCGGTPFSSLTSNIIISPSITTQYFVRAEGTCNTTNCNSINVSVYYLSSIADSVIATPDSICPWVNSTITIFGGILGTQANWNWYTVSCGGTFILSGTSTIISPTVSTTYYIRAEDYCNTTNCLSITITLKTRSIRNNSANANPQTICQGSATTLGISGGTLGTGANWYWYTVSCGGTLGGTLVATGASPVVSPTVTTSYYVRAEGTCNTTPDCVSVTVFVNTLSTIGSVISDTICFNKDTVIINMNGGILGTGASWHWYDNYCGGNQVGSAIPLIQITTTTTTYWINAAGTCNTTLCVSLTIYVDRIISYSPPQMSINPSPICQGSQTTLSISGGSFSPYSVWHWYTNYCGGTSIGTGTSIVQSPTISTMYWVGAISVCDPSRCVSAYLIVNDLSILPDSITASSTSLCHGTSVTLTLNSGSLGTNAAWYWWKGGCRSNFICTGTSISITPNVSHYYYVLASGLCDTTGCDSIYINVNDTSTGPTLALANPGTICQGSNTTLSQSGGNLGNGTNWSWYISSCSGSAIASGYPVVSPSVTTTYFVNAANSCNTTQCASVTVIVETISIQPNSISSSPPIICSGNPLTLSLTGGSLGTLAIWKWYTVSCGGTFLFTGQSPVISPTITNVYYVRAEGICNTTTCLSVTISVNTSSVAANFAFAIPDSICPNSSSTLSISGGSLGIGANWFWYTGSCGGNLVYSGLSRIINISATTCYWVRAENICSIINCVSVTVTYNSISVAPNVAYAFQPVICPSQQSVLWFPGGILGTGATWNWYTGSCGGIFLHSGNTYTVSPTTTTNYYLLASGVCNTTACITVNVLVDTTSVSADSISGNSPICNGTPILLTGIGGSTGTGAIWKWYQNYCIGTLVGTGTIISVTPSTTTTFYVRAVGSCNTTTCVSKIIIVNLYSIQPDSIKPVQNIVCPGNSTSFNMYGATLGSGANWFWYTGTCGGTYIYSGSSFVVSPTITSVYYLRAVGICNTTICLSVTVTLGNYSVPPGYVIGPFSLCNGSSTILSVGQGNLGLNATWKWYTGSCGGISIGSSTTSSIIINPTVTTVYYVRAEGQCNLTTCLSWVVTVNNYSVQADSARAFPVPLCIGNSTTLTSYGGTLVSGANWYWYSGSCGGTYIKSGNPAVVSPTLTLTYFVRAEGSCNTTNCLSVTVTLLNNSIPPGSVTINPANICQGLTSTISLSGGSLGTGASWYWYSGYCGSYFAAVGTSIVVSPTVTTTFYIRAEGQCNTTICVSRTVTVNDSSFIGIAKASQTDICYGSIGNITLSVSGGTLGSGAYWHWYTGSCVGTSIVYPVVSFPTVTTTYWVKAIGTCNATSCNSVTVLINTLSTAPTNITVSYFGNIPVLTAPVTNLGVGGNYFWYTGSCGGVYSSSGNPDTLYYTNSSTTTYWVRAENACNTTTCISITVNVTCHSLSGKFTYDDAGSTPLDSVMVYLERLNYNILDSVRADITGYYYFSCVQNNSYRLTAKTHKPWGGVNSTDAVKVKLHFAHSQLLTSSIRLHSADVNLSYSINTTDAVKITKRFVGSDTSFTRGDWVFEKPYGGDTINVSVDLNDTVILNGANVTQNMKGLCIGDVNGSYNPPQGKSIHKIYLDCNNSINLNAGTYYELPVRVNEAMNVSAVSLKLKYPKNLVNIFSIKLLFNGDTLIANVDSNFIYNIINNELYISWFTDSITSNISNGDALLLICLRTSNTFSHGDEIEFTLVNDPLCELADENTDPMYNITLFIDKIVNGTNSKGQDNHNNKNTNKSNGVNINNKENYVYNDMIIVPNPAKEFVNVKYRIASNGFVNISLYNIFGEKMVNIVNKFQLKGEYNSVFNSSSLQPGFYFGMMLIDGRSIEIKKIIIAR